MQRVQQCLLCLSTLHCCATWTHQPWLVQTMQKSLWRLLLCFSRLYSHVFVMLHVWQKVRKYPNAMRKSFSDCKPCLWRVKCNQITLHMWVFFLPIWVWLSFTVLISSIFLHTQAKNPQLHLIKLDLFCNHFKSGLFFVHHQSLVHFPT